MNALTKGSKHEINLALTAYKQPNGVVYFPALFEIKSENRLPALAAKDYSKILGLVTGGLTLAIESMNLARPLNDDQLIDLAETILESSNEDNLALEDLMLFLQKLTRGEYGKLYESMDIPKFMEFFEKYREQRFQALRNIKDEFDASHAPDYSEERFSEQSKHDEKMLQLKAVLEYNKTRKK